jgi:hypothetical protein
MILKMRKGRRLKKYRRHAIGFIQIDKEELDQLPQQVDAEYGRHLAEIPLELSHQLPQNLLAQLYKFIPKLEKNF